MAIASKCPKCESTRFEAAKEKPEYSKYVLLFIRCASCGCVVGVLDLWNIGEQVNKLLKDKNISL